MKRVIYTLLGMMLSVGAWADTLQEQINAVADGGTLTLTDNVTISQTILINKNITIDGGGHTITSSVKNKLGTFYVNVPASNFNITNATIDGNTEASMAVVAYRGVAKSDFSGVESVVNKNPDNRITLTNCTVKNFTGYPGSYVGAIYAFSTSTFNLTNCTFTGNTTTLSTDGASGADVWAGAAATVNIIGGNYQEVFVNSNASDHAAITISNGATVAELAVCVTENGGTTNQPSITVDGAAVTNIKTETGNLIPATAVTIKNGGTVSNIPTTYVAQIGDKKYTSLADAIAAATADQTVTLLGDITVSTVDAFTIDKKITLDLAGHNITSTVKQPIHVVAAGDLTITGNGTIAGPEGEDGKALDGYAMITVEGGKLTYLNGTLTCGGVGSDGMYGVYILNGGTAIFGEEAGKTGPTITSWFAAIGENNTTAPAYITVYGGSYTAKATPTDSDRWSYFCAPIYAAGSGKIDIYDGEFNGYYGLSSRYSNVDQDLNIYGGTFKGTKQALFFDNQTGVASEKTRDVAVSGGTFSTEVPEEYCADGYSPVTTPNSDGMYTVETTKVAKVGDNRYTTLQEAVNAAKGIENAVVTLLLDMTLESRVDIEGSMTIDLDGKTITTTATCGNGSAFNVKSGNVTIQNGVIDAAFGEANSGETDAITARSGSEITLKELQVTVNTKNGACAYAFSGGHITIESGIYKNISTETYQYNPLFHAMVVNQANEENLLVEIKGGTFYGQDPADGDDSGKVITFLPETLATVSNVDASGVVFYSVVDAEASIGVKGYATLDKAIDIAKDATEATTVKLLADAETTKEVLPEGVTINANSKVLTMPSFVVLDGQPLVFPKITGTETYKVVKATYIRTNIAATMWGTVCLPFTLTNGNGANYYTYGSITDNTLTVNETTEAIAAHTPVVFNKTTADLEINEMDATVSLTTPESLTSGALIGTYSALTVPAESGTYFINSDKFHQVQASLTVPAYRAYIKYSGSGAKPSVLSILVNDGFADGIEAITTENAPSMAIYDANGRQVANLQKGLNIIKLVNGKTVKVIVK